MLNRKMILVCVGFVLVSTFSGCVQETSDGSAFVFTYELWAPLSALLGGIVATPAGWFLRKKSSYALVLYIGGPILGLLVAPSLFMDRAVVDENGLALRTGIWGLTARHEVKFDDLKEVRLVSEQKSGRRGRKTTSYYLICDRKDGSSAKVPLGSKVAEAAAPVFIQFAKELGISVLNQT